MKQTLLKKSNVLLILSIVLFTAYGYAQRTVRIAYVDMEYILENVEEYREASTQLESKAQKWKVEIEQKQSVVEQIKKDLMAEKVLLTDELIAERQEDIQILEAEVFDYQQDRFGPQGDFVLQKQRLIQPIQDQVFNEVQKIGTNKKYDFIFDKSADVVMLFSQKRHDISDQVLRGISRTRKISAPKKKASSRTRFEDSEDGEPVEEEMSDALKERLGKAKEAEAARTKTADEKKAEQVKLREERKKAYEARRKKLLEEREAKKKEKLEERKTGTEEEKETKEEGETENDKI